MTAQSTGPEKKEPPKKSFWKRHKTKLIRAVMTQTNILGWFAAFYYWEIDLFAMILAIIIIMISATILEMTY